MHNRRGLTGISTTRYIELHSINRYSGGYSLKATGRSFIAFLVVLLLAGATASMLHAHDKSWSISYVYSGESISPIDYPYDPNNPVVLSIPLSVTASGTVKATSPTGAIQNINIADIGASDYLLMDEAGVYQLEEKYTLIIKESALLWVTQAFQGTDTWNYNNAVPGLALFTQDDMSISDYTVQLDSDVL